MDFYIVLGLGRDATLEDVKRAYKRLARRLHPDINPGDRKAAAQFREIAAAYETLSDPARRDRYDSGGLSGPDSETRTVGFEGFDFSVSVSGAEAPTFGDLFSEIWHQRAHQIDPAGPQRGADIHQVLTLPFEVAVRGGVWPVTVTRQERCRGCDGAGTLGASDRECPHCQGGGAVRTARGHMVFSRPCLSCRGTGRQPDARCPACDGQQREMRTDTIAVQVPPGVAADARLVVPGRGHAGRSGGGPGDLHVTVQVEPHPVFTRHGDDLHLTVAVAVHEAALGARVEVPSLDRPARLRVPPGTQSGQRFRLRERGVVSARDGRRGDLVVEVRLVLPRVLDERSKELLREFGRLNSEDVRLSDTSPRPAPAGGPAEREPRP